MVVILAIGRAVDILYVQDYVCCVSSLGTVIVTSRSFSSGELDLVAELEAAHCRVVWGPSDHDLSQLRAGLMSADAWIAGTGPITEAHLSFAPRLQVIARYGVGIEAVDLAAAERRGVLVTNAPGANTIAVAEHTVALILAALRGITVGDREVRDHIWRVHRGRQLAGLTAGVVGLGRVGSAVATRLSALGVLLLGHDPWLTPGEFEQRGVTPVDLDALAARSDVITLHAPGEREIISQQLLDRVRPGAVLINTARAALVDEQAVTAALRSGRVGCYATDVLSAESGAQSPLLSDDLADRTILTPHIAAQTVEAVDGMGRAAADCVLAALRGERPEAVVTGGGR